jgi:hypothetical protein
MVDVAMEVVFLSRNVAAKGSVVSLVIGLSHEVQAVQLVEDLNGNPEAALACGRVRNLESAVGIHAHFDHFFTGDHGIGD